MDYPFMKDALVVLLSIISFCSRTTAVNQTETGIPKVQVQQEGGK